MENILPTIIIPAHNEEKSIRKTLESLEKGLLKDFQVIVVCNGCTDSTFQLVSSFKSITCETIPVASKISAIQHAESLNPSFPRLYLDADIKLTAEDAKKIFEQIQSAQKPGLYIPRSRTNTIPCDVSVQYYYKYWYKTNFVKTLGFGAGVYGLNESGRKRFLDWPEVISDDGYIRTLFDINEIHIIESACVEVIAPKTYWQLIRIKARSKFGNLQLQKLLPSSPQKQQILNTPKLEDSKKMIAKALLSKINYLAINAIALVWAHWMMRTNRFSWLSDNSKH